MSKPFTLAAALALLTSPVASASEPAAAAATAAFTEAKVVVDGGYKPSTVEVVAGKPVRITFEKKDYSGCTREVVFPTLGLKRTLKTNEPVVIELPPQAKGGLEFHCGMKMVKGKLVVVDAPAK